MGYQRDDRHGGGDNRWRDRDERWSGSDRDRDFRSEQSRGSGWNEGRREATGWGSGWDGGSGDRGGYGGEGGDRDRGFLQRAGEEVRSWFGGNHGPEERGDYERGRDPSGGSYGWMSGGWGNQAGESWNRDRPGARSEREGWFTDSIGGERGERFGGSGGGYGPASRGSGNPSGPGPITGGRGGQPQGGGRHDPLYSEWRRRQIEDLDRDYEEYRREHQSKFEQEFGGWRQKRQGQRQMLNKVSEHMEVIGSDGQPVGTVDKVRGDRIILAKSDENAGGIHHSIPCSWVESVDERVTVNKTAAEAISAWRDEERSRALFEREDSGSPGPHMLNRSFSGTYSDRDD